MLLYSALWQVDYTYRSKQHQKAVEDLRAELEEEEEVLDTGSFQPEAGVSAEQDNLSEGEAQPLSEAETDDNDDSSAEPTCKSACIKQAYTFDTKVGLCSKVWRTSAKTSVFFTYCRRCCALCTLLRLP